ncbi:glycoside hydrolase family 130 protein [Lentiprolixibacter aurantiacus]|uniref:Glycoside hydrolase family 130 protein n=1 Tax=Lentiprolixibacter aurantiacus TaxID=2993939 RepID=A0AAE3MN27_9FLAO|nr:glycoside hydrolase family 130 protein [Lentiprolixibacter aurantiacus]MCX2719902.1 glycoside hydrolase family 130 protein [Lentiprolixibacter aurantiacus]
MTSFVHFCAVGQDTWMLGFEKPVQNPIMQADSSFTFKCPITNKLVRWQKADVFNPGAIVRNDTVFLLFRAEDNPNAILGGRTSRIGLAYSINGIDFVKGPEPVLFPDQDEFRKWDFPGGVEDPRIVELEDGTYMMLYTSWNQDVARLSSATSRDLINWKKHGPVFREAHKGRFLNTWSKSGSVVTELKNGRLLAKKFNGNYLMYWGELFVNLAISPDGISWIPLLDEKGDLLKVFQPTLNDFDSHLTEPGPPALYTEDGILLLYNGKNLNGEGASDKVPEGTYCGGQVLFNKENPTQVLARLEEPFICPDLPHEITGQYQAGTTFIQGLVYFKDKWYLYYGTADSMVGLAIKE